MDWKTIRQRIPNCRTDEALAGLFNEVLGPSAAWVPAYKDWLVRWNFHLGQSDLDAARFKPANVDTFLQDSVFPAPDDPEAKAVLEAIRRDFHLVPRDGVGKTTAETIGVIRQAVRELAIRRAAAARHQPGVDSAGDAYREGFAASPRLMLAKLCGLLGKLSEKMNVAGDCFCGQSGQPEFESFETGWRFHPDVLKVLEVFVNDFQGKDDGKATAEQQTTEANPPGPWVQPGSPAGD